MKRHILIFVYCLLCTVYCFSQDFTPPAPPKPKKEKTPFPDRDKVYFGGGLGLWFGTRTSFVNLSPIVGYRVTEKYSAGVGITYINIQDRSYAPPITLNAFGGNIFNRFLLTDFLFAHAEYEILNGNWTLTERRFNLENIWVGGGLRQHAGGSSLMIYALWNLNETLYSKAYFPSPQIRVGLGIGL